MFIRPHWLENRASIYALLCRELERAGLETKVLQQSKQYLYETLMGMNNDKCA